MSIPLLPSLNPADASFKLDVDAFFLTQLPATVAAMNSELERVAAIGYGSYTATSVTELAISTGAKGVVIEAGKSFAVGQLVLIASTARKIADHSATLWRLNFHHISLSCEAW